MRHWSERIKALYEWSLEYEWNAHLDRLNHQFNLQGDEKLSLSLPGCPPAFFNGNVEALEPGSWVLVVSINPALAADGHYPPVPKEESWNFWCEHNRNQSNWNTRTGFFSNMTRLASAAGGETLAQAAKPDFATNRMLFLEFIPYASKKFMRKDWEKVVKPLADSDIGCAINRQIRQIALIEGRPSSILLHGLPAVYDFKDHSCPDLMDYEHYLVDDANSGRKMGVWDGTYRGYQHTAPVTGFRFIRESKSLPPSSSQVAFLEQHLRTRRDG